MNKLKRPIRKMSAFLAVLACASVLSACSTPKNADKYAELDYDPIEPINRGFFEFNKVFDGLLLNPITQGYEIIVPEQGQIMVSNFVDNLGEPITFTNSIFQLDAKNTVYTLGRFLINTTVGVAGLFDVADKLGIANRPTGFADTMAIYGADAGPYLVVPVFGPSSVRDGIGKVFDVVADPISYTNNPIFYSVVGVKTIDARHRNRKVLDDVYNNSIDPYSALRSIYTQHRSAAVKKTIEQRNKSVDETFK